MYVYKALLDKDTTTNFQLNTFFSSIKDVCKRVQFWRSKFNVGFHALSQKRILFELIRERLYRSSLMIQGTAKPEIWKFSVFSETLYFGKKSHKHKVELALCTSQAL